MYVSTVWVYSSQYLAAEEGAGICTGDSVQDVLYGLRQPGWQGCHILLYLLVFSQCNQIFVYIPNCSNKFKLTFDSISELNLTELIALNWIFNFSSICMGMQYTLKCLFQHTYTSIRYTLHTTHSRKFEW